MTRFRGVGSRRPSGLRSVRVILLRRPFLRRSPQLVVLTVGTPGIRVETRRAGVGLHLAVRTEGGIAFLRRLLPSAGAEPRKGRRLRGRWRNGGRCSAVARCRSRDLAVCPSTVAQGVPTLRPGQRRPELRRGARGVEGRWSDPVRLNWDGTCVVIEVERQRPSPAPAGRAVLQERPASARSRLIRRGRSGPRGGRTPRACPELRS